MICTASIIDTNNGREVGLHINGNLVAIRTGGKRAPFRPPYSNRMDGQTSVCPLILNTFKLAA